MRKSRLLGVSTYFRHSAQNLNVHSIALRDCTTSTQEYNGRQAWKEINLQTIGMRVLLARDPEEKVTLTQNAWRQLETLPSTHCTRETERLLNETETGGVVSMEEREILRRVRYSDFDDEKTSGFDSLVHENRWEGIVNRDSDMSQDSIPEFPGRPSKPYLVEAKEFKRPRVPLEVYILHSLAHIELNAIGKVLDVAEKKHTTN